MPHQLEPDGSMIPVSSETAVAPSIKRTWFLSLVTGLLGKVTRRDGTSIEGTSPEEADGEDETDDGSVASSDVPGSGAATPREGGGTGGGKNGRAVAATMAGGRRRKGVNGRKK